MEQQYKYSENMSHVTIKFYQGTAKNKTFQKSTEKKSGFHGANEARQEQLEQANNVLINL